MQNPSEETIPPNLVVPAEMTETTPTLHPTLEMMKHFATPEVTTGVATGVLVSAGASIGKSALRRFLMRPLVLFGLGVGIGVSASYWVCKNRKAIISSAAEEAPSED